MQNLFDRAETCAFFGGTRPIDASTLYRGIKTGRYPKPVKIGPGSSRCPLCECLSGSLDQFRIVGAIERSRSEIKRRRHALEYRHLGSPPTPCPGWPSTTPPSVHPLTDAGHWQPGCVGLILRMRRL
jgi:hypothetical protein